MRHAEWQRRPGDPKTPLGWLGKRFVARGWPLYILMGVAMAVGIVWGSVWASMGSALALLIANTLRLAWRPDALRPLLAEPAPEGQFRAVVEYRKDGLVTGRDQMAVTAVDGWLVGEGVRSSFAVRSEDVTRLRNQRRWSRSMLWLANGTQMSVAGRGQEAHPALIAWRIGSDRPEGEPVFPPAKSHPQEVGRAIGLALAGIVSIATAALLLSVFGEGMKEIGSLCLFAGGLMTWFGSRRIHDLSVISIQAGREPSRDDPPKTFSGPALTPEELSRPVFRRRTAEPARVFVGSRGAEEGTEGQ